MAVAVNPLQNCFGEEGELLGLCGGQIALAGPSWEQEFAVRVARLAQRAKHRAAIPSTNRPVLPPALHAAVRARAVSASQVSGTCDSVPLPCSLLSLCLGPCHSATPVLQVCIGAGITTVGGPKFQQKTKIRIDLQALPLPSSANLSPVCSPSPCLVKSGGKRGKTTASFPCLG